MGPTPDSWTLDRRLRYHQLQRLLRLVGRPGRVLELGAGAGGLVAMGHDQPVVTVDVVRSPGLGVQADGCRLPFPDGAFVTAVCVDVLEHLPVERRDELLGEIARVTSDLVVVGGPVGDGSLGLDVRLRTWLRRRGSPVPEWLEEHVAVGSFPTAGESRRLPGGSKLVEEPGLARWAHGSLTLIGAVRGGTRAQRAVPDRWMGAVARVAGLGTPYRTLVAFDRQPVTFSVVVATKDRAGLLPTALESVLAQTDHDLEVVVLDDASSDDTPEVVRSFVARDGRVRYLRRDSPSGSCGMARNAALPHLRGRYLAICDDDVRWHPDHLERCRVALARSEACTTRAARFLPDGRRFDTVGGDWGPELPETAAVDANCLVIARHLVRRFPDGRGRYGSEDIRLVRELAGRGVSFTHVDAETVDYTFNLDSHCYDYTIVEGADGQVTVDSVPVVNDLRGAFGRVSEAVEVRVRRLRHRLRPAARR